MTVERKEIVVERMVDNGEATIGSIWLRSYDKDSKVVGLDEFMGFTLEDEYRPIEKKVKGETRIPAGAYNIGVRTVGGFNRRYGASRHYKDMHKGMLQIGVNGPDNGLNRLGTVPGFSYILIHTGNDGEDTGGCLLVGWGVSISSDQNYISNSRKCYRNLYSKVIDWALKGKLSIRISDRDRG